MERPDLDLVLQRLTARNASLERELCAVMVGAGLDRTALSAAAECAATCPDEIKNPVMVTLARQLDHRPPRSRAVEQLGRASLDKLSQRHGARLMRV